MSGACQPTVTTASWHLIQAIKCLELADMRLMAVGALMSAPWSTLDVQIYNLRPTPPTSTASISDGNYYLN